MTDPQQPDRAMPDLPRSTDRTAGLAAMPDHAEAVARIVARVPCPTCHAKVTEPCTGPRDGGGREPLADVHVRRYDAGSVRRQRPAEATKPDAGMQPVGAVLQFEGRCRYCEATFPYSTVGMVIGERSMPLSGPKSVCDLEDCRAQEAQRVAEREREERETADAELSRRRREAFTKWVPDLYHVKARPGHAAHTSHIVPELRPWEPGMSAYIDGPPGSGKSHQVACMMLRVAGRVGMEWYSSRRLIADLLASYSNKRVERPAVFGAPCASPVLVLNDLFAERATEHTVTELGNLIDARYEAGLPIVVTSNLSLSEAAAKFDTKRSDAAQVAEELLRITTRLLEMTAAPLGIRHRMDELDWRTAIATQAQVSG